MGNSKSKFPSYELSREGGRYYLIPHIWKLHGCALRHTGILRTLLIEVGSFFNGADNVIVGWSCAIA